MSDTNSAKSSDEIDLLDVVARLAESWLIIVLVPFMAAILGFLYAQSQPAVLRSAVTIALSASDSETLIAKAVSTGRANLAVAKVITRLSFAQAPSLKFTVVSITADPGEDPQALLSEIVGSLNAMVDNIQVGRRADLAAARRRLEDLEALSGAVRKRLEMIYPAVVDNEAVRAVAALAESSAALMRQAQSDQETIRTMEVQLRETGNNLIIDGPSAPVEVPVRSPLLTAIVAALGAAFFAVVFVLLRASVRNAAKNPESAAKLNRIKRALLFR